MVVKAFDFNICIRQQDTDLLGPVDFPIWTYYAFKLVHKKKPYNEIKYWYTSIVANLF